MDNSTLVATAATVVTFLFWSFVGVIHLITASKNTTLRKTSKLVSAQEVKDFFSRETDSLRSFFQKGRRAGIKIRPLDPKYQTLADRRRTIAENGRNEYKKNRGSKDARVVRDAGTNNRNVFSFLVGANRQRTRFAHFGNGSKRVASNSQRHAQPLTREDSMYRVQSSKAIVNSLTASFRQGELGMSSMDFEKEMRRPTRKLSVKARSVIMAVDREIHSRATSDALAIISEQGENKGVVFGREDASCFGMTLKRWFGWGVLMFEFPLLWVQPFLVKGVWPPVLEEPLLKLGKSLFFKVSLDGTRAICICALVIMLALETSRRALQRLPKARESSLWDFRLWGCRAMYEFLYISIVSTMVVPIKTHLCVQVRANGTFTNETSACEAGSGEDSLLEILDIFGAMLVLTLLFHFAVRYMLLEKNTQNPSFRYFDMFNVAFHIAKAVLSAITGLYSHLPIFVLCAYALSFTLLGYANYHLQPCLGRGRVVNNMRSVLFSGGAYICICGLFAYAFVNGGNNGNGTFYATFGFGMCVVGGAAWAINNKRAARFSIPRKSWHEILLRGGETLHARTSAAVAARLHIENLGGCFYDGDLLLSLQRRVTDRKERSLVKWNSAISFLTAISSLLASRGGESNVVTEVYFEAVGRRVARRRSSLLRSPKGKKRGVKQESKTSRVLVDNPKLLFNMCTATYIIEAGMYCSDLVANWSTTVSEDLRVAAAQTLLRVHNALQKKNSFLSAVLKGCKGDQGDDLLLKFMKDERILALSYAFALLGALQSPPFSRVAPPFEYLSQFLFKRRRYYQLDRLLPFDDATRMTPSQEGRYMECGALYKSVENEIVGCVSKWYVMRRARYKGTRANNVLSEQQEMRILLIVESLWNVACSGANLSRHLDVTLGFTAEVDMDSCLEFPIGMVISPGWMGIIKILSTLVFSSNLLVHFLSTVIFEGILASYSREEIVGGSDSAAFWKNYDAMKKEAALLDDVCQSIIGCFKPADRKWRPIPEKCICVLVPLFHKTKGREETGAPHLEQARRSIVLARIGNALTRSRMDSFLKHWRARSKREEHKMLQAATSGNSDIWHEETKRHTALGHLFAPSISDQESIKYVKDMDTSDTLWSLLHDEDYGEFGEWFDSVRAIPSTGPSEYTMAASAELFTRSRSVTSDKSDSKEDIISYGTGKNISKLFLSEAE